MIRAPGIFHGDAGRRNVRAVLAVADFREEND
jgi:hypothetical protein